MKRFLFSAALATSLINAQAQTMFHVTNVTLTEKEEVRKGLEVTAEMHGAEGSDRIVIFDRDGIRVEARASVHTHNVRRSSVKDGAVYVTFEIRLEMAGDRQKRLVEKVFYAEQERRTHFREKFTLKEGITVRAVTLEFDGALD